MSKKKQAVKRQPTTKDTIKRKSTQDSFSNALGRLGMDQPGMMGATDYTLTRLTRNYNLLNTLYRNSWIAKKVIETIPGDMVKNWFSITADLKPEITDRYNDLEQRTCTKDKINEGLCWGDLYGGAAAIMMIAGEEDLLDQPLEIDNIMPNSYCGLLIVDRWSGIYPGIERIEDIRDPEFGLPIWYEVRDVTKDNAMVKVHHSRVLRFCGRRLPYWENMAEIGWGASQLEHVFDELAKRDNTSWNIASLVFQANLIVNKVTDFDQITAATDPDVQRDFYAVKSAQNQMRNNNGMMIIGDKDEVSAMNYTFAGLNDIYESQMLDIAGASEIPVTKLFGRAPAGMNATGESDLQNYYDMVSQRQESQLKPIINKLLPVMFMSEFGQVPDDLGIRFNAIQTPTEDKMADIVAKKTTCIYGAYDNGIISQQMALKELQELSYTTNMFSSITNEIVEAASDDITPKGETDLVGENYGLETPTQNRNGLPEATNEPI
jgi:phage-related protein (TIGR01555 family)